MIRIFRSEKQGKEFYSLMGPFFASLDIAQELERQVYNKPDTEWYLVFDGPIVAGFVSIRDACKYYFIDNLWVDPQYRERGFGYDLAHTACCAHRDKPLKCIAVNPYALRIFGKLGFVEVGSRGKYKRLEKH